MSDQDTEAPVTPTDATSDPQRPPLAQSRSYEWLGAAAFLVIVLDQVTKALIVRAFEVGESVTVLGPVMSLTRRTNTGGAFGMLQGSAPALTIVSGIVILVLLLIGPRLAGRSRLSLVALGLVLGGATGNLIDRARLGHVVDFVDFHFWPVFNIADMGITIGAILILVAIIFERKAEKPTDSP